MSDLTQRLAGLSPEQRALLVKRFQERGQQAGGGRIPRRPRTMAAFPLSFAQERLWFVQQLVPESPLYNSPTTAIRIDGPFLPGILTRALTEMVRRHEPLRTVFATREGRPVQVVADPLPFRLPLVDLSGLPEEGRRAEVLRRVDDEMRRPFHLAAGPLLRVGLFRLAPSIHVLSFAMHHIVSDGWSAGVFFRELWTLYRAFCAGLPSPLPEPPVQYVDFAAWQREWLQGEVVERQLAAWTRRLAGELPVLDVPADRPRPAVQSFRGALAEMTLPAALQTALRELARRLRVTPFILFLSAYDVLLHRITGQEDLCIGSPVANRQRPELQEMIGCLVNVLVLRADLGGDPLFRDLVEQVRQVTLEAYEHQDLPFERLVEALQPQRALSHGPLFQVAFSFPDNPMREVELPGCALSRVEAHTGTAKFDLVFELLDIGGELVVAAEHSRDLFDAVTVERLLGHYRTLLEHLAAGGGGRLSDLPLLAAAERRQVLAEWNDTGSAAAGDARALTDLVAEQAERAPGAPAAACGGSELTYRELTSRAHQLGRHLLALGVRPEERVGLCVERSLDLPVGLLGILAAGAAFVPLDPALPAERLEWLLGDAGIGVVVTQSALAPRLPAGSRRLVLLDHDAAEIARRRPAPPGVETLPGQLAWVIYTSGSTGRPKGVLVAHAGVPNLAAAQHGQLGVEAGCRVLQLSSLSFDASLFDVIMALASGGCLCLASRDSVMPGPPLLEVLRRERITHVTLPPSALAALPAAELPDLRSICVAGEACPAELVERWGNGRRFFNLYGPTEATIWATTAQCRPGELRPPIGRPIPNVRVYLLDRRGQPVPPGVAGEIYLGGPGLARGYLNRPDLTAERFVPDPWGPAPGERLYRTGDLARRRPDGTLDFAGRVDFQVKIRGFRIEPGEIEAALLRHPALREAAVVPRPDHLSELRLVAYAAVAEGESAPSAADLRAFLARLLPEHMIPAVFVTLPRLPVNASGKVDRKALPAPEGGRPDLAASYAAPRDPRERSLAALWASLLGLERVGIHDNFFELGGHSLLLTRMLEGLRAADGHEVPITALFQYPTIATLAAHLDPPVPAAAPRIDDRVLRQRAALLAQRNRQRAKPEERL